MNKKKLSQLDKILLCQQLALIIESDMSLTEGLALIAKKNDHPVVTEMANRLREHLKQGDTITEAFEKEHALLGIYFVNMIKIGERSGNLQQIFEQMAVIFERKETVNRKIRSAINYPILLTVFMIAVILLILIKVLPLFDEIIGNVGGEMPGLTQALMSIGQFFAQDGLLFLVIILILGAGGIYWSRTPSGRKLADRMRIKMPFFGPIVQYAFGASFSRNLSLLIHSGISLPVALQMLAETEENTYFKEQLNKAVLQSKEGHSLDVIIETMGLFPWLLIKLVAVAEVSGQLDVVLIKAATTLEQETEVRLQRVLGIIEPALVTILSVCIGLILVAVVLPVFAILNQI